MNAAKRIKMLERVLMSVATHPIDHRLSAETCRMILEDLQQVCHAAATDPDFDLEAYEPVEDWKPVCKTIHSAMRGH